MGAVDKKKQSNKEDAMLRTKVCQRCKKVFAYSGFGHLYCPRCKTADDRDFEIVKDYIIANPGATMLQVADETGIYMKYIETYLKEGRLEIPENSPIFITCEICKKEIRYGRVCVDCADKLTKKKKEEMNFDDYQIGERPKKVGKMRYGRRD